MFTRVPTIMLENVYPYQVIMGLISSTPLLTAITILPSISESLGCPRTTFIEKNPKNINKTKQNKTKQNMLPLTFIFAKRAHLFPLYQANAV